MDKWNGFQQHSLVETRTRCVKLLGERAMVHDFDRQVAELQVRAAVLNRFMGLGTPIMVAMSQVRLFRANSLLTLVAQQSRITRRMLRSRPTVTLLMMRYRNAACLS